MQELEVYKADNLGLLGTVLDLEEKGLVFLNLGVEDLCFEILEGVSSKQFFGGRESILEESDAWKYKWRRVFIEKISDCYSSNAHNFCSTSIVKVYSKSKCTSTTTVIFKKMLADVMGNASFSVVDKCEF